MVCSDASVSYQWFWQLCNLLFQKVESRFSFGGGRQWKDLIGMITWFSCLSTKSANISMGLYNDDKSTGSRNSKSVYRCSKFGLIIILTDEAAEQCNSNGQLLSSWSVKLFLHFLQKFFQTVFLGFVVYSDIVEMKVSSSLSDEIIIISKPLEATCVVSNVKGYVVELIKMFVNFESLITILLYTLLKLSVLIK